MAHQNVQQLTRNYTIAANIPRRLVTPTARLPLRPDFPDFIHFDYCDSSKKAANALLKKISRALALVGADISSINHMTIAYPQKDPVTMPGHKNNAHDVALKFRDILAPTTPLVTWCLADSIVEMRHLNRSGDRSLLNALTGRQKYALRPELQTTPLPWLNFGAGPHFAIMVDQCTEMGTTFMNMASMLQANGFSVIGACIVTNASTSVNLKQNEMNTSMSFLPPYPQYQENLVKISRAEQMGLAFAKSVLEHFSKKVDDTKCLTLFDTFLEPHGVKHTTLTDAECVKIIHDYGIFHRNFGCLLQNLKEIASQNQRAKAEIQKQSLC